VSYHAPFVKELLFLPLKLSCNQNSKGSDGSYYNLKSFIYKHFYVLALNLSNLLP
jgi:hypothetical protein